MREQFRIVKQIVRLLTSRPFPSSADCYRFSMIAALSAAIRHQETPHRFRSHTPFLFSSAYLVV